MPSSRPRGPIRNLRDFLAVLRAERGVVEVDARVSTDQEIAEIHRRVIAADGPALLFRNVEGSAFPVLTNMFGTRRRVDIAFGEEPLQFVRDAAHLAETIMPPTPAKLWGARKLAMRGLKMGLKWKRSAPIVEVVDEKPNLESLPLLKLWPKDGGHFVTLPLVETRDPVDRKPNLGMYRMQRFDARTTGMHWQIGKGGGFHYAEAERLSQPLPVTVTLGGPPALILSAIAPLPEGIPEFMLASLLLGERLPRTRWGASKRELFAEAEFALVGQVAPKTRRPEGPFGDHYGYYSLTHDYPVFECQAICRRRDAIYPATVVGKPRQEDFYIGDYLQELLSPLFPLVMPQVNSLWSYGETGFHSLSAAIVKERYGREAMASAFRILGEGQLSLTKFLLLANNPVDLRDFKSTFEHILERCRFETDLYVFSHLSMDTLDYAGPEVNKGSKGVLMGVGEPIRELPRAWTGGDPPAGARDPIPYCGGCLVLGGPAYADDPKFAERLAADQKLRDWPFVVLCDNPRQATAADINFLWTAFTRFEPAADLHSASVELVRRHPSFKPPVVLDARMKPWYPEEVSCDPDVAKKVESRWKEYFPAGGVEMGDGERAHLAPTR